MTDADTLANAEDLWAIVHTIQAQVNKDGTPNPRSKYATHGWTKFLKDLRAMADECDPENGRV